MMAQTIALLVFALVGSAIATDAPALPPLKPLPIALVWRVPTGVATNITQDQLPALALALQHQLNDDVAPAWTGIGSIRLRPVVYYVGKPGTNGVPLVAWQVQLLAPAKGVKLFCAWNDPGSASGCHGYLPNGLPYAQIDIGKLSGIGGASTYVSHESVEMYLNPILTRCALHKARVEGVDPFASLYYIGFGGVAMNDFAYPEWFGLRAGTRYDFQNVVNITAPAPWTLPRNTDPARSPLGFIFMGHC